MFLPELRGLGPVHDQPGQSPADIAFIGVLLLIMTSGQPQLSSRSHGVQKLVPLQQHQSKAYMFHGTVGAELIRFHCSRKIVLLRLQPLQQNLIRLRVYVFRTHRYVSGGCRRPYNCRPFVLSACAGHCFPPYYKRS